MAEATSKRQHGLAAVLGVLGVVAYFTFGREAEHKYAMSEMTDISNHVADDAVAQYEIAKRQGDKMQTCVQAGLVTAGFLQAKNEPKYVAWKAVEKADCAAAGVAQP